MQTAINGGRNAFKDAFRMQRPRLRRPLRAPALKIYWHFNSKEGLLAAVMDRGARRWFAALPPWEDLEGDPADRVEALVTAGAQAVAGHPGFLRLFYLRALDNGGDAQVGERCGRSGPVPSPTSRRRSRGCWRSTTTRRSRARPQPSCHVSRWPPPTGFFALQLEPEEADIHRLHGQLVLAVQALAPAVIADITARREPKE
ncbi:TetR/AcrR family transcriptional regulator [Spirillospora sp. CA-142024]|uniref:TetR/AcrR family transcriptional regulator n=1 Tax=Spirillospora sp. CA-142024 TaxID=3240036 RepID=UPI003D8FD0B1